MNSLEPGNGGLPAPSPEDAQANPPNPIGLKPKAAPASAMMQHFNSHEDAALERFKTVRESKKQIDAVMSEFGQLAAMKDTVTSKDVVKAAGGIVAAGVPAIQMASILADMPEQGQDLQGWVQHEFELAQKADQQVVQALNFLRHQLISSSLQTLIAHSAEAQHQAALLSGPAQGNA